MTRAEWVAAGGLSILFLAGCGPISAPDGTEARFELDAIGDVSVQMVVSRRFAPVDPGDGAAGDQILLDGDTVWAELPMAEQYDIDESGRFFIEVIDAEPNDIAVNLRVWIDEDLEYDYTGALSDGILRYIFVRNH